MNGFLRRLLNYDTVDALIAIGYGQMEVISERNLQIAALRLEHSRLSRDLIEKFLLYINTGEEGIHEQLLAALADLQDEVARLEEHAPR